MNLTPHHIKARDLSDAWFQAVDLILNKGHKYTVEHGSYVGQQRWELDYITIHVTHPGIRPLIPEMPTHLSHIPPPTTMDYVIEYLPYMMEDEQLKDNEFYTYGERIRPQMIKIIEQYKNNGYNSNQECISVSKPSDINLKDGPCLRNIDLRIKFAHQRYSLHFFIYFRSWDLWGGFPANLAAIRIMQEYMAMEIGVDPGEMILSSKGLHIYDHVWDIAKLRTSNK